MRSTQKASPLGVPQPSAYITEEWNKNRWLHEVLVHRLRGVVDDPHRLRLSDLWELISGAFEEYRQSGGVANTPAGDFWSALRPSPLTKIIKDPFTDGFPVARFNPSSTFAAEYRNPLFDVLHPDPAVLALNYKNVDEQARFHSHHGEQFNFISSLPSAASGESGKLKLDFWVPSRDGKTGRLRSFVLDPSNRHARSLWFMGDMPHRGVLVEGKAHAGVRVLSFYADPLGEHALLDSHPSRVTGLGAKYCTALDSASADADTPKNAEILATFMGVGSRLHRLRTQRGWTITNLAKAAGLDAPRLSRIESGDVAPTLGMISNITSWLDVPLGDVLPDGSISWVGGCHTLRANVVPDAESLPKMYHLGNARTDLGDQPRMQLPYRLREHGLLVLLAGSPRARNLLPMLLYVGDNPDWDDLRRAIGRRNAKRLQESRFHNSSGNLCVFGVEGAIRIEAARYRDSHLLPMLAQKLHQLDSDLVDKSGPVEEGQLLHLRAGHPHRFRLGHGHDHCKALLVLSRQAGLSSAIELLLQDELRELAQEMNGVR